MSNPTLPSASSSLVQEPPPFVLNEAGFATRVATPATSQQIAIGIYRFVVLGVVLSLLWKAAYYPLAINFYQQLQLADPFFPNVMRSNLSLMLLMGAPVGLSLLALGWPQRILMRLQAISLALGMAGLCWHQGSYNDVTFLTCFWVALWICWYTFSIDQPLDRLLPKARTLAALILSMIFLGGAVGKFTPGYWSGEVLYQVYFVDRDFWFFNLLRSSFDETGLRTFATGYSRMVVIVETLGAFLWLLPARIALGLALLILSGIILFSNFNLLSVMFCLLGLCLAGIYSPPAQDVNSS